MIWKICKYCTLKQGNCVTVCKKCGNDKFWGIYSKKHKSIEEFKYGETTK